MKILIVDLSGVFRALWHASQDKPVSFAFDSTLGIVRRASAGFERTVIACDAGRSFRKDISGAYKIQRDRPDHTMIEQLRRTVEALERDGFAVCIAPKDPKSKDGASYFEADDVIATVTEKVVACGFGVEILSSDKDLLALVRDEPAPVRARHWQKDNALFGPAELAASDKYGVRPDQMRDFLTLVGDPSDGIMGVAKVGPETAKKLLRRFDDISGIVANLDAQEDGKPIVTPVVRENIRAAASGWPNSGSLATSRDLVTLRTDVPINLDALLAKREAQPQRPDFAAGAPPEDDPEDFQDEPPDEEDSRPEPQASSAAAPSGSATASVVELPAGREPSPSGERLASDTGGAGRQAKPEETKEPASSQAIVVAEPIEWSRMIEPRTPSGAHWLATQMFESRLFSGYGNNGAQSPEACLALIYAGRELGIGAVASLRGLNIIRGRVSMTAMLMVGLCLARAAEYFELVESSPTAATWETKRRGRERAHRLTFTLEQAKSMMLYPGKRGERNEPTMWEKDPENMLVQRAASRLARRVYPDVLMGAVYTVEELEDE